MILENLKNIIKETETLTPKTQNFNYSFISLYDSVIKLDDILSFRRGNTSEILVEVPSTIYFCLRLLNDFDLPINTDQFSFDQFRSDIKPYQTPGVTTHKFYITPLMSTLGKIASLLKQITKNDAELKLNEKTLLLNFLYDVLSKILLIIDYLNLKIEVVLESTLKECKTRAVNSKKKNKKTNEEI